MRQENIAYAAVSATTNQPAVVTVNSLYISVQAVATGTLAGTLKLQASNDAPVAANATTLVPPSNWNDIPSATVAITGTPGSFLIPKTDLCYQYIRAVFTASGGTGTVTIRMKLIGA